MKLCKLDDLSTYRLMRFSKMNKKTTRQTIKLTLKDVSSILQMIVNEYDLIVTHKCLTVNQLFLKIVVTIESHSKYR